MHTRDIFSSQSSQCCWHKRAEVRDAVKYPTIHRTVLQQRTSYPTKELLIVPRLRNPASDHERNLKIVHLTFLLAGVMHKVTKYEMTCIQSTANGARAQIIDQCFPLNLPELTAIIDQCFPLNIPELTAFVCFCIKWPVYFNATSLWSGHQERRYIYQCRPPRREDSLSSGWFWKGRREPSRPPAPCPRPISQAEWCHWSPRWSSQAWVDSDQFMVLTVNHEERMSHAVLFPFRRKRACPKHAHFMTV